MSFLLPLVIIPVVLIVTVVLIVLFVQFLCQTDRLPLPLKILCPGGILKNILPGFLGDVISDAGIEAPTDTALCGNPDFKAKNPELCQKVSEELFDKCVSDARKNEIGTDQAKIDQEISNLKSKGVFLSKDKQKCLQCSGGYSRSLLFGEDSDKACTNATSPIKISTEPTEQKLPDKSASKRGSITLAGEKLCKNKFPASESYEASQLKFGTFECWSCPKGYQKKGLSRFGSGSECKPETGGGLFCGGSGRFIGPKKAGSLLSLGTACYKCPAGFSENLLVTKATLAGGLAGLATRRALFFERGCVNRTTGTPDKPFKTATPYTPLVEKFGSVFN